MKPDRKPPTDRRRTPWLPRLGLALLVAAAPAAADVVVVVGARSGTAPLAREHVSDIFMGKNASLPGGVSAVLVDLPEANPLREEFYAKMTGKTAAQARAYWAKLSFTGKGTPPREVASSAEVKKTVAGTPGGIGYIERSAVDDSVRVVYGN